MSSYPHSVGMYFILTEANRLNVYKVIHSDRCIISGTDYVRFTYMSCVDGHTITRTLIAFCSFYFFTKIEIQKMGDTVGLNFDLSFL